MDLDKALDFLRHHHRAVLLTRHRDGRPQMSPITVGVQDGRVVISSRETAAKVRNALRDPAVSLCAFTDGFFGEWIQVDGTAEIIHLPEAMDLLVTYYRDISGEHPDWDDYRAAMERDRRVIMRITPTRVGPTRHG
ncbi:Pyridoxine 5'-phosphate oxidase, Rv1155 [[Actinomadura] parvosata subsp. kistnae]|uniref:PPOX class F420-dependent enzyme n=2 Tax=Nonomuraea TaxID=83681 RepID=A0A1V0AEV1_9ACTN|nr:MULTISPECIES: PPOX class F420-dependent oxidoreductase [unclassified Nonomuraea]AQZ68716.1 PPOX class F420-dependent enzyme [Nonomuraea sp. ATCC 55076]NJP89704.1 PPOX class F420-dependent oxidoreductase [Nonomuraea sp. FMUSA5-5]SPL92793.1 Pyridoxine 5'-phosphate oxidase, Rv1155 [Actinomadura parvosata subsp. kistnae]